MNGWARASMLEAIDSLARAGQNDLATDLNRIVARIDFEALEILRCPGTERLADEILDADGLASLLGSLGRLAGALGVSHCTVHVVTEAPTTSFTTRVLTTYPGEWISRYVDRRYSIIDPVISACRGSSAAFYWDSLPDGNDPGLAGFWSDSVACGVGPSGFTQPVATERGDTLGISVCSAVGPDAFREHFGRYEGDLFTLGVFLADTFCRLASDDRPAAFNPTDDQLVVLRAIAMGASEDDLRARSYRYGSYHTLERSIRALFRTRTLSQAAILAARTGLLADAPLSKADFLSAAAAIAADQPMARPSDTSLRRLARRRARTSEAPPVAR